MGLLMAEKLYRVRRGRLRSARTRAGLTQMALAREADVSKAQISRIENGVHPSPHFPTIDALAAAIGVSRDYLIEYLDSDEGTALEGEPQPQYPGDARSEGDFDEFLDYEEERRSEGATSPEKGDDGESGVR